jgi:uncharacterized membrane protein YhaH (DUF805 family)
MSLPEAVRKVLSNYANFHGRAERSEFWWWALAVLIATMIAQALDASIFGPQVVMGGGGGLFSAVVGLGLLIPNIAVAVRRLHDTGRSGWLLLLLLIPIIGFLALLYFYLQPGTPEENRFGPRPIPAAA